MPDRRLDATYVRQQIDLLRVTHPGIWEDDDPQLLMDSLEGETDLMEFLSHVVFRLHEDNAFAQGIDAQIVKFKARQARYEQRSEAMRTLAHKVMNWAQLRKAELPLATLSIRNGTPKVVITDEAALPDSCVRVKREPDKGAIKNLLALGNHIPGAEMSNAEPVLAIRVK